MRRTDTEYWDFLILTALQEEFISVRQAFDPAFKSKSLWENDIGQLYSLELQPSGAKTLKGLVAKPNHMGRLSAAILTAYTLARHSFGIIGLTGLAGGLRARKTNSDEYPSLGDIVFAESIIDIDMVKLDDARLYNYSGSTYLKITRPRVIDISKEVRKRFSTFCKSEVFYRRKKSENSFNIPDRNTPRAFITPFLSTNVVVASSDQAAKLANHAARFEPYKVPTVIEMESYGVAEAANTISAGTPLFVIKAINDYADQRKADDESLWRTESCDNAAIATRNFLEYFYSQ